MSALPASGSVAPPPSIRRNALYVTIANTAYAASQWSLLVLLAQLGDATRIGRFALALGVVTPVFQFTNLQLRDLLATEPQDGRSPRTYVVLRGLGIVVGFVAALACVPLWGTATGGFAAVAALAAYKAVDAGCDLIYGALQRREQLERVARSLIARAALAPVAGAAALWFGADDIGFALGIAAAWGLVLVWDLVTASRQRLFDGRPVSRTDTTRLLATAWPMGGVMAILALYVSIPRLWLEGAAGTGAVGVLAALAYLQVPLGTVATAVAASASPRMARLVADEDWAAARVLMRRLLLVGAAAGLAAIVGFLALGPWFARLAYGPAVTGSRAAFAFLGVSTAAVVLGNFAGSMATALRIIRPQLVIHVSSIGCLAIVCALAIPAWGVTGALAALAVAQGLASAGFGVLVWTRMREAPR